MKRLSSIDVLNILREYKLEKKPIRVKDSFIYFNNNKFPLNTETGTFTPNFIYLFFSSLAWKSKLTEKRYDLGSLWLCLEHHEKQSNTSQYFTEVDRLKLSMVSNVDKEEIVNYFTGKIEFTEAINQELRSLFY